MPRPMPRVVKMDEVEIIRESDCAVFRYRDARMGSLQMRIGPELAHLSDRELLDLHNQEMRRMQAMAASCDHRPVEIVGRPQIEYSERCGQWIPRGDVLRCFVDGDPSGEPFIEIDDTRLSLREFGELLLTREGWGMRLVFVPDTELHKTPRIRVRPGKREDRA